MQQRQASELLSSSLVIRSMVAEDLPAATELSEEQQWPHRREDWDLFLSFGEGLVAEQAGQVVGTTLGWRFGSDRAAIGLVIVRSALQRRGIGRKLMEAMIDQLGGRSISLSSTEAGVAFLTGLGFVETGRIYQHQGLVHEVPLPELRPGERVRPKGRADGVLAELYSDSTGTDRHELFHALAANCRTVVKSREHEAVGFAMLRRFGAGWSIAPVVASDSHSAKTLILHWLAAKKGRFCRVDVTTESGLSGWLEDLGLPCVGSVRTMVRGSAPVPGSRAKVFAVAAQGLG
ncbi:N-acetyltransferase [Sphingosinicella microcystinivorans]|uniref:N-acetyltransferase n=1 Tax=Sphingosinicella microcystinivorans TaxID=335406 RepID=A0AAD1G0W3_SPHMI|nr:GNAT family N-acetyltransferase [Sphingosinicella microcystinivorans]BBE34079.1 N-acetyltransferase [Sphingosinicella microcystinivorans]